MSTYGSFDDAAIVDVMGSGGLLPLPVTPIPEKERNGAQVFCNGKTGGTLVGTSGTKLVFRDVCVTIDQTQILRSVSGVARSGEVLAILGPSGAGKSTLLNVLTARLVANSGHVTLDGQEVTRPLRRKISYVQQQDVFYPGLTLRETLAFTAMIRLPESMSRERKSKRIQEVVDLLELNKCIGTKMGGTFDPGLSGGERKRATIACELIANPKVLILDEPTSGLDSAIASSLMSAMTEYAKKWNKIVLTTIHQPSSQIFHMFSTILLLTDGQVAYYGPRCEIVDHFAKLGLHCDPHCNLADFVLEQLKGDKETVKNMIDAALALRDEDGWPIELKGRGREHRRRKWNVNGNGWSSRTTSTSSHHDDAEHCRALIEGPGSDPESNDADPVPAVSEPKWPTGFLTQYTTLTRRAMVMSRNRIFSLRIFCQIFLIPVIASLEWFQLPRTEARAKDKLGLIFFIIQQQSFFSVYNSIYLLFDDHGVFLRERSAGIYRLSAYYLSINTAELPTTIVFQAIFINVIYWTTGLMPDALNFSAFWAIHLLIILTAQSLGLFMGAAVPDKLNSLTVCSTIVIVSALTGGFYNAHVATWFRWFRRTSLMSYAISALTEIEFTHGDPLRCNPANLTSFPEYCLNGTLIPGEAFVEHSNIRASSLTTAIFVLISISIVLRTVAYFIIRFFRRPKC